MPTFRYTARDSAGSMQAGSIVADSESAALRLLNDRRLYPTEIAPAETSEGGLAFVRRVRLSELSGFYGQLSDLLGGGVPMLRSLDVLSRQKAGRLSPVIAELREDVAAGAALADAMEKHTLVFPELHVGMVRAGEQGGFLESVLGRLAALVEQRDQLRNKVIGSMIYPVFLLVAGLVVVLVMVTYFMPKLEPLFADMQVPALTRGVMAFGNAVRSYGWLFGLVIVLAVMMVLPYFRTPEGRRRLDRFKIRVPGVGPILLMVAICRFCRVLGTLLANGVPMLPSLTIARESAGNVILSEVIGDATEAVRAGRGLGRTLSASGLFPDSVVDIISVAEETNRLDVVLVDVADRQEQRLARQVETAVRMLEPLMLLIVFAMVLVIAIAFLLPILQAGLANPGL